MTAMAHNLVSTARERRFDVGVIRALGAEGGRLRAAVHVQSMIDVGIVLFIGIPTGLIVGRLGFALVADRVGVMSDARLAHEFVPILIVGAVFVMNLAAFLPGRHAGRAPASQLLSQHWRQ